MYVPRSKTVFSRRDPLAGGALDDTPNQRIFQIDKTLKQKFAYSQNFYYLCTIFVKNLQMNEILLAILAIGIAILLLSLGVILRKDHKFRSEHISQNQRMRQDGIHCATSQDREARKKEKLNIED